MAATTPPPNFKEFITQKAFINTDIPVVTMARAIVDAYDKFNAHYANKICAVCGQDLTPQEQFPALYWFDFNKTCTDHAKYRNYFDVERERQALNFYERRKQFF